MTFSRHHSRRDFIRGISIAAGAGLASNWMLDLGSVSSAAPLPGSGGSSASIGTASADDYRALVCVFLHGGNDHWDTFVPNDPESYRAYSMARSAIARPLAAVRALDPTGGFSGAGTFGLAPGLDGLGDLFDQGSMAIVANIGTLRRPISKSAYASVSNRPAQLFSHNDQASMWQSSSPEGATRGWSGAIADRRRALNESPVFTSISVAGNAVMMSGREAVQYQVSPGGVTTLADGARAFRHPSAFAGVQEILATPRTGPFGSALSSVSGRAIASASQLSAAVEAVGNDINDLFDLGSPNQSLVAAAEQLAMVARLIAAGRTQLGMRRQAFFVSIGGFDTHESMLFRHDVLHDTLNSVLPAFHRATRQLGVGEGVTTFTASDFGRGLVSNGSGADHGWGGHHMVIGDQVAGRRVVGKVPVVADDGPNDVGRGRLLPTIGVTQYAATFARWMGVADADLSYVAPGLDNFAVRDLGLFKTAPTDPPIVPGGDGNDVKKPDPPPTRPDVATISGGAPASGLRVAVRLNPGG